MNMNYAKFTVYTRIYGEKSLRILWLTSLPCFEYENSAAYIFTINVNKSTLIADIIINRDIYINENVHEIPFQRRHIFNILISRSINSSSSKFVSFDTLAF